MCLKPSIIFWVEAVVIQDEVNFLLLRVTTPQVSHKIWPLLYFVIWPLIAPVATLSATNSQCLMSLVCAFKTMHNLFMSSFYIAIRSFQNWQAWFFICC